MTQSNKLAVRKVPTGYQVFHLTGADTIGAPFNEKVYFHPTSAYAALGRIVHAENVKGFDSDPAKVPSKS